MISHHHKCIFVHIPKNAGQSIEHVFLNDLGLDWRRRAPLLLRPNENPELGPPHLAHLKASEYVSLKYVSQEMFEEYFKFAFVRNPWDRVVSMYKYYGFSHRCSFKRFVIDHFSKRIWQERYWFVGPQHEYICGSDGTNLVDLVGRFERLQEDFDIVCQKIGLQRTELPHVNKSKYKNARLSLNPRKLAGFVLHNWRQMRSRQIGKFTNFREYYDNESVDIVGQLYQRDIELFEYEFE